MHTSTPAGTAAPSPSTPAEPTAPPGVVGRTARYVQAEGAELWVYPTDKQDRLTVAFSIGTAANFSTRLTREKAEEFAQAILLALVS